MKNLFTVLFISLFIFSCGKKVEVRGCDDRSACNYDPKVNVPVPGSCLEEDCLYVCGGDSVYSDETCGSCYVNLWRECYSISETSELDLYKNDRIGVRSSGNFITGTIPPEIENLKNLTYLNISDNFLQGEIPPEIGNLTNLTFLTLHTNKLTGQIPAEIGNLTNLHTLSLANNQLSGEIPQEVCDLIKNNDLDIYYILLGNNDLVNTCD